MLTSGPDVVDVPLMGIFRHRITGARMNMRRLEVSPVQRGATKNWMVLVAVVPLVCVCT